MIFGTNGSGLCVHFLQIQLRLLSLLLNFLRHRRHGLTISPYVFCCMAFPPFAMLYLCVDLGQHQSGFCFAPDRWPAVPEFAFDLVVSVILEDLGHTACHLVCWQSLSAMVVILKVANALGVE